MQVFEFLKKENFINACVCMAEYEAEQVFPRGIGTDWKNYNPEMHVPYLKIIFYSVPQILQEIPQEELYHIRLSAAMCFLWGNHNYKKWLPQNFILSSGLDPKIAVHLMRSFGSNQNSLQRYLINKNIVIGVILMSAHDACPECKKIS